MQVAAHDKDGGFPGGISVEMASPQPASLSSVPEWQHAQPKRESTGATTASLIPQAQHPEDQDWRLAVSGRGRRVHLHTVYHGQSCGQSCAPAAAFLLLSLVAFAVGLHSLQADASSLFDQSAEPPPATPSHVSAVWSPSTPLEPPLLSPAPPPPVPPLPAPPPPAIPPKPESPSPPSTPPAAPSRSDIVRRINLRFKNGAPSSELAAVGVLFHTFDAVEGARERDDLWTPCPRNMWCHAYGEHFSASLLNHDLPHFFNEKMSGFILSPYALEPASTSVRCAYAYDAGTMGTTGGCPAGRCDHTQNLDWCWWSGSQLQEMVNYHLHRRHKGGCGLDNCDYNELILESTALSAALPTAIEAVFFPVGSANGEAKARRVLRAFKEAFGESVRTTPLVSYDLQKVDGSPFTLVSEEDEYE
jgi:hypothetical protein